MAHTQVKGINKWTLLCEKACCPESWTLIPWMKSKRSSPSSFRIRMSLLIVRLPDRLPSDLEWDDWSTLWCLCARERRGGDIFLFQLDRTKRTGASCGDNNR